MATALKPLASLAAIRDQAEKLAHLAATPLVPEDYLDLLSPLASRTDLRGRITAIERETADAATLIIKPGRLWLGSVAGQYIRIGIDIDGVRHWRAYSLTSAPERGDGCIAITVKAIPDGVVSNYLVRRATIGTIVQMDQATGDFRLGDRPPKQALFVTAGSGITPVMGILRSGGEALNDAVVVHCAPTAVEMIFRDELQALAANGAITLIERHTELDGIIDAPALSALVPDLDQRETWACGPAGLLDELERHFAETGIAEQLHTERFRPTIVVTGDGGTVTFRGSDARVEADGATPLLDVGEKAGVLMPSGCRMGICFGCVAPLREGAVRDLRTGDLTMAAPGDDVRIQTCISAAAGPCEIDL